MTSGTRNATHRQRHTHTRRPAHTPVLGQRHLEFQVRHTDHQIKHTNPERQMYIYTQIQTPDSQINTHTNASTDTQTDEQIITHTPCTTNRQTSGRDTQTFKQPESDVETHTHDMETEGHLRLRRKDREVGGDEKMEMRPGA